MIEDVRRKIEEAGYEDIIIFDNPDYSTAFLGVTTSGHAIYDYELMVEYLVQKCEMDYESAADFICYNDSFYYGKEAYPLILNRLE